MATRLTKLFLILAAGTFVADSLGLAANVKTSAPDFVAQRAEAAPALHFQGTIEADFAKEVDVSPRVNGRLAEIKVEPGQEVAKGQVVAVIDSREISEIEAELMDTQAKLKSAEANQDRERQLFEENLARPKSLLEAKHLFQEAEVQKNLAEETFHRQEGLFKEKIIAAKDYQKAQAALEDARLQYKHAHVSLQREESLFKNKAMMSRDYQLAKAETVRDKQHRDTLVQRLKFLGMDQKRINQVLSAGQMSGAINVLAPVSGVVSHHEVSPGEMVTAEKEMFKITDLSTVRVGIEVPEVSIPKIKKGTKVKVAVKAYPHEYFFGIVNFISQHVQPQSHAVLVRAQLDNKSKKLKVGMAAEVDVVE